jgi:ubiquinone/menaquinone biosynthesis C-methylase UbiE
MSGIKTGDRLLQIGLGDGRVFAALAGKVGLSGEAHGIDDRADGVERGRAAAAKAGVLVDVHHGPYDALPYEGDRFDLVVILNALASMAPEARVACLREAFRVIRPGGRCLVMEVAPRGGLAGLLSRREADSAYAAHGGAERALEAEGFKGARRLAEREGVSFSEAAKPRSAPA